MTRTDGDSWDLASSVGATATMVAGQRAFAHREQLINDPYAEPLVRAVGLDFFTKALDGDIDLSAVNPAFTPRRAAEGMTVRTRWFDQLFLDAAATGVRQAVILAAGLDARAYRLPWPDGTVVFEVDQPEVIEFKSTTLAGLGATPTATRRTVAVDLRDDWPAALTAAGFDACVPTAWLAEGLLPYLPPDAQDRLFDLVTAHSAAGSQIAVEAFSMDMTNQAEQDRIARRERTARMRELSGIDIDVDTLTYADGDRADAAAWLAEHGWSVDAVPSEVEMTRLGRQVPDYEAEEIASSVLLRAELPEETR